MHELILEFFSTFKFREAVVDLDTARALRFLLGGAESGRKISEKGDLSAYWRHISSEGDFLGTTPSYTLIRDPMLRLCHRLIACSIARRRQAPKKVTVTNLFYLRGMNVGSVNIPYRLARYLRLSASRRKQRAMIFGGQVVGDALAVNEGALANPAPMQALQPPHAAPMTMPQRIVRIEEVVHELR
nr:hypothetical protein [Tanacetum cinerariifolium]GFB24168.1 hypothetical protein [Tanacetum cinerariifolium]